ncbi:MAG TPA: xanthine dehydrogenase family protein molybdopterin-binding subunit, partial [Nitrolancea sp.]|nr:xanthine dehydrogenase family protein molybdopterin-binding subunit [Nitrolancea sp.]
MSSTLQPGRYVGKSIKRVNDPRLITGHGSFVDDIRLPGLGTLHAAFVRSPYAHAEIGAIDAGPALQLPGVVAVVTGRELAELVRPQPAEGLPPHRVLRRYPLVFDRARFAGDPVAVVVAEDPYTAADAAELVQVEYRPLPAVTNVEAALAGGAPLLYPEWGDNLAWTWTVESGDVDGALANAAHVVEVRLVNQRLYPAFIEPRAVLVNYVPVTGELTAWASSQTPHRLRGTLAEALGIPENLVRGIAPDVGGAFGAKGPVYPEYITVAALARTLGRPVKWTESRSESFVGTTHGRDQIQRLRAAVDADGVLSALEVELLSNCGAYNAATVAQRTGQMSVGPYFIQAIRTVVRGVMTNTSPTGAYRGAGRPEAAYMLERLTEAVARELKLDPAEVRRRNFTPRDRFPYVAPTDLVYDSGDYQRTLDTALDRIGYQELRAEQERLRREGRLIGIGIGFFCERAGPGWDSGEARVQPSGTIVVTTGISPHGQGEETTFAQIVADELGIPLEDVTVKASDTAITPQGIGTFGSRGTSVGGSAVLLAVRQVKEKARRIAAQMLEAGEEDTEFDDGRFQVRGAPDRSVTFKQVARVAYGMNGIPNGLEPGLDATSYFMPN